MTETAREATEAFSGDDGFSMDFSFDVFDIPEAIAASVEEMMRLSAHGHFGKARSISDNLLAHHMDIFPVAAERMRLLYDQSDFEELSRVSGDWLESANERPWSTEKEELQRIVQVINRVATAERSVSSNSCDLTHVLSKYPRGEIDEASPEEILEFVWSVHEGLLQPYLTIDSTSLLNFMGGLLDSRPTWACARLVELCTLQLKSDLARTLWRSPRALNAGPPRVTGDVIGTSIYLDFALASYEAYLAYSHKDPVYFGESGEAAISSDHRIPNPRFYIKQIMHGEDGTSLASINSLVKTLEASEPKNDSRNWRRELRSILIRIDYMLSESHKRNALLIKPLLTVLERLRDLAAGNDDKYMMRVIAWRSHRLAWLVDTEAQATLLPTSSAAVVTKSLRDRRRGLLRSDRVPSGVYNDFLAREWLHAHPSVMDRRGIFTDPMRWNNIPSRSLPAPSELALLSEDSDWSHDYPLEYGAARNQRDIFSNDSAWAESSLVSDESLNSQDVLSSDEREYNVMQPPVDASKTQPVRANARSEGVK